MFHTDRDVAEFMNLLLVLLGTSTAAVYAAAILVALVLKAFRSLRALRISFVLSAIASIPLVLVCTLNILFGEWLGSNMSLFPDPLDDWPVLEWCRADIAILIPEVLLLGFVWVAPLRQYRAWRRATSGSAVPPIPGDDHGREG